MEIFKNILLTENEVNTAFAEVQERYPHLRYYLMVRNQDGTEWWIAQNGLSMREVSTNSEMACKKVIVLAGAILEGVVPPFTHAVLRRKAEQLLGGS